MNRSSLPLGLNTLYKYWNSEEKQLDCTLSFQRHSGMWNSITKSNLVWSILADSYIPPIVLLKDKSGMNEKGKDVFKFSILDGQQRLTTLFEFMSEDGFALHGATESVEYDGFVYDIAGKRFCELEEELQDAIKGYRFSIQCIENYTFDEIERLFYNINSGVSLSTTQKSKAKLGNELISFLNELLAKDFFTQGINITEAQARREDDLLLLLQIMLLLDNQNEGFEYKNISAATCLSYASDMRGNYDAKKCEHLEKLIDYLSEVFPAKSKFMRKNNVPVVAICAGIAMNNGVDAKSFKSFINEFSNNIYPAYEEASGSGNVKAPSVRMRLRVMFLAMCEYYNWETDGVEMPFSDDIPLYISDLQKAELSANEPSVEEEPESEEDSGDTDAKDIDENNPDETVPVDSEYNDDQMGSEVIENYGEEN